MNGLPKPCYVMSEPHLSGYRVVLGYETLTEAQDAQSALAASPPAREEAPAEGAIDWLMGQRRIQASASVRNGNKTVNHEEIVGFIDQAILALRDRTSEPAREACQNDYVPTKTITNPAPASATADKLRGIIDAAADAALPPVCDVTGSGTKERASIQVEIANRILAALTEEG